MARTSSNDKSSSEGSTPMPDPAVKPTKTKFVAPTESSGLSGAEIGLIVLGTITLFGVVVWSLFYVSKTSSGPSLAVRVLYYFLPYGIFIFSCVSDLVVQQAHFSPGAAIAVVSVVLNWVIARFITGGEVRRDLDICGIPGLSWLGSPYISQNLLFSGILLSYIVSYSYTKVESMVWSLFGLALGFLIIQIVVATQSCANLNLSTGPYFFNSALAIGGGVGIGLGIGILSGYLMAEYGPNYDNSSSPTSAIFVKRPKIHGNVAGSPGVGSCSAPNDQDQFVCEAYKNGKLVTSTIAE